MPVTWPTTPGTWAAVPTIELLLDGAGVVAVWRTWASPKGPKPELSLRPVADRLSELLSARDRLRR
jgi:3-phosphoglycerate kinase